MDNRMKKFLNVWLNAMVVASTVYWMGVAVMIILANWNLWQGMVQSMPW
jgi:hypothetical protein